MNSKTRQLTEGAMIVAIISIIIIADRLSAGIVYSYAFFLMPLPLLIYAAKYGFKVSLIPFVCSNIISLVYSYDLYMKALVLFGGLIGIIYGCGTASDKPMSKVLVLTFILTLLSEISSSFAIPTLLGYNINTEIKEMFDYYADFMNKLGYQFDNAFEIFKTVYYIAVVVTSVLETFVTHILANIILSRLKIKHQTMKKIGILELPKWLSWSMIVLLVFAYANNYYQLIPQINDVLTIVANICTLIFMFFGYYELCLLSRFLNKRIRIITVIIVVILFVIFPFVLLPVGVLSCVTNAREQIILALTKKN